MSESASGHYGALGIPTLAPAAGEAVTDKALTVLGGYLLAFVNTYGAGAWAAVGGGSVPIRKFYTHDPREVAINEHDFPSLYLFRIGGEPPEQFALEYRLTTDNVMALWIFPRDGSQEIARVRRPFLAGLTKLFDRALRKMRDPCFVVLGDPDPKAIEYGSSLLLGGIVECVPYGAWAPSVVSVEADEARSTPGAKYRALAYPMRLRERDEDGLSDFDALEGVDVSLSLTSPDGALVLAEYRNGPT